VTDVLPIDRISIEPTRRCSKACSFCYNGSGPGVAGEWGAQELINFAVDAAAHGVAALSLGGGEPLEWPAVIEVLRALQGTLFRSLTTNGLPLERPEVFAALISAQPDKVHISIHAPESPREVARVAQQVRALAAAGIKSGVNLLVRRSRLVEATVAARTLHASGIGNDRIVYLPMRGDARETPTPEEIARVAGGRFQSMTCLGGCAKSARFVSIAADRTVAWCSYTVSRRPLVAPTWAALLDALEGLGLTFCGEQLVRLGRAS